MVCVVSLKKISLSKQAKFFSSVFKKKDLLMWTHFLFLYLNASVCTIHSYDLCKSTSVMFDHVFIISLRRLCQTCLSSSVLSVKTSCLFFFYLSKILISSVKRTRPLDSLRTGHGHCPNAKQEVMPEHSFLPFLLFYGGCCGWVPPAVKELTMWTFQPFSLGRIVT